MSATSEAIVVKARLRNFGEGTFELTGDTVKFYAKTGRLRKRREIIREIPMTEVESLERQGNDLSIGWKGTTDMFVMEQTTQLDTIHERISKYLTERTKEKEKQTASDKKRNELGQTIAQTIETSDSLFNILRSLHGRVDWKIVEIGCKQSEENAGRLSNLSANSICLDLKPLSTAGHEHRPKETAEKAYGALKALYNQFDELSSSAESSEQYHPNQHDAKLVVQATYILNDLALGAVVGDQETEKEGGELLKVLDDLSKLPGSKIDGNSARTSLSKLCADKEKQLETVESIKSLIKQQIVELIGQTQIISPPPSA